MASKVVVNADKLAIKLVKLGQIDLTKALTECALIVEAAAKKNCPKGNTGELRASITHNVEADKAEVGTNKSYAPYVELGTGLFAANGDGRKDVPWVYCDAEGNFHSTSGQYPQPYLLPALVFNKARIQQIISKAIVKESKNIAGR